MPHFECGAIDHSATSADATLAGAIGGDASCGKKGWLPMRVLIPTAAARRPIIACALAWGGNVLVSRPCCTDRREQRPLGVAGDPRAVKVGVQIAFEIVVTRHFVALAAPLAQPLLDVEGPALAPVERANSLVDVRAEFAELLDVRKQSAADLLLIGIGQIRQVGDCQFKTLDHGSSATSHLPRLRE
jgi:hypothetical protein